MISFLICFFVFFSLSLSPKSARDGNNESATYFY